MMPIGSIANDAHAQHRRAGSWWVFAGLGGSSRVFAGLREAFWGPSYTRAPIEPPMDHPVMLPMGIVAETRRPTGKSSIKRARRAEKKALAEQVVFAWDDHVADRAVAAGEGGPANERHRAAGGLAENEFGGRGQLIGHVPHR